MRRCGDVCGWSYPAGTKLAAQDIPASRRLRVSVSAFSVFPCPPLACATQRAVDGTGQGLPFAGTFAVIALPSGVCHL